MAGFSSDLLGLDGPSAAGPGSTAAGSGAPAEEDIRAKIRALKLANAQLKAKAKKGEKNSEKKNKKRNGSEKASGGGSGSSNSSSGSSSSDNSDSDSSSSDSSSDSDSSDSSDSNSDVDDEGPAAQAGATKATKKKVQKKKSKSASSNNGGGAEDDDAASFFDSLADKPAEDVEISGHNYVVNLRCTTGGSGIVWETDFEGKIATVKSFKRNEHGQHGPAANSGLIEVGHVLIAIDGKRVVGSAFEDQLRLLEGVATSESRGEYVLKMCDTERRF